MPKENNHPTGKNSPNLVTLTARSHFHTLGGKMLNKKGESGLKRNKWDKF
jgi:hypothetical protein